MRLFPILECLTSVVAASGLECQPYAHGLYFRCLRIIGNTMAANAIADAKVIFNCQYYIIINTHPLSTQHHCQYVTAPCTERESCIFSEISILTRILCLSAPLLLLLLPFNKWCFPSRYCAVESLIHHSSQLYTLFPSFTLQPFSSSLYTTPHPIPTILSPSSPHPPTNTHPSSLLTIPPPPPHPHTHPRLQRTLSRTQTPARAVPHRALLMDCSRTGTEPMTMMYLLRISQSAPWMY